MGHATEELAEHLGHGVGGLLNATFGNAAELIIALIALSKGLTGVVKASITGSIIGNVLLVMGASILAGGMKFREQRFNKTAARTSTTTLTLAAVALAIPTVFHVTATGHLVFRRYFAVFRYVSSWEFRRERGKSREAGAGIEPAIL
jgi:Ca2+:H+ antiporter